MVPYLYIVGVQVTLLLAIGHCYRQQQTTHSDDLEVLYEWNSVDFLWPSERARDEAIKRKEYIPNNIAVLDVDVYDPTIHNVVCKEKYNSCARIKKKVFVTTPRVNRGIPAVLSTVSDRQRDGKQLLKPFPDWYHNREGNCDGITSVFRTNIDECGRLWVLDTGVVDSFAEKPRRICSPQILVYDLNAGDKLVGRYPIPKSVLDSDSLLINILVDVRNGECKDAFAYLTDVISFKLIVFDERREAYHRVVHNSFYPYPDHGDFNIAGTQFQLMDGLFGLALGPLENKDRRLFYHSFASVKESWVMTSTIRDRQAFLKDERSYSNSFFSFAKERASQSGPEVMSKDGVLFFSQVTQNAIACWNSELEYKVDNTPIIAQNDVTMQFASGMKLIGDELYVLSSRLQKYLDGSVSDSEINYRVLHGSASDLIRGTPCENSDWSDYINYDGFEPESFGEGLNLNSIELGAIAPQAGPSLSLSNYSTSYSTADLTRPFFYSNEPLKYVKCDLSKDPTCFLKTHTLSSPKGLVNPFKYGPGLKFLKTKPEIKPLVGYAYKAPSAAIFGNPDSQNRTKVGSPTTNIIYYNPIRHPLELETYDGSNEPPGEFGAKLKPHFRGGRTNFQESVRDFKELEYSAETPFNPNSYYPARPPSLFEYTINHPPTRPFLQGAKNLVRALLDSDKEKPRETDQVRGPYSKVRFSRFTRK